jgi:hypothetical protein
MGLSIVRVSHGIRGVRANPRRMVAATAFLAAVSPAVSSAALGGSPDPRRDATVIEHLVAGVDLDTFARTADDRMGGDQWLDWSTDWCSAPLVGSTGRSFDFRQPCRRHDFAYRNTKLLDVRYGCADRQPGVVCTTWTHGRWWNASSRAVIDRQFRHDMRRTCRVRLVIERPMCLLWAEVFYRAVRATGGP